MTKAEQVRFRHTPGHPLLMPSTQPGQNHTWHTAVFYQGQSICRHQFPSGLPIPQCLPLHHCKRCSAEPAQARISRETHMPAEVGGNFQVWNGSRKAFQTVRLGNRMSHLRWQTADHFGACHYRRHVQQAVYL